MLNKAKNELIKLLNNENYSNEFKLEKIDELVRLYKFQLKRAVGQTERKFRCPGCKNVFTASEWNYATNEHYSMNICDIAKEMDSGGIKGRYYFCKCCNDIVDGAMISERF